MHRGISPPGTAPDEHSVLIVAYPIPSGPSGHLPLTGGVGPGPPLRGTRSCSLLHHFRRAKTEWHSKLPPGHWALASPKLHSVRFNFCAWLCRTNGTWSINDGRPKGLPYPTLEEFLENRRGGACPSRGPENAPASLFVVGAAHWAARRCIKTPAPDRSIPRLSGAVCLRGNALSFPKVSPGCPSTPPSLL